MRTMTSSSSTRRMMRMGGRGGMMRGGYNIPANTKAGFNQSSAKQSTNYGNNSYPATNAFSGGSKFTHTNAGVG